MNTIDEILRDFYTKQRSEINKVINSVLEKYGIFMDNPNYYERVKISTQNEVKTWCIDGNPVFVEYPPEFKNDGCKITAFTKYQEL